jgi:4-hydroxyphenylpyruvate dioxygenase-like putative hemolysin
MLVQRSVRPLRDCDKNILKINDKKESQIRYILRMREGILIQLIAMEIHNIVKATNPANFGGCMLRGLVSAKNRF